MLSLAAPPSIAPIGHDARPAKPISSMAQVEGSGADIAGGDVQFAVAKAHAAIGDYVGECGIQRAAASGAAPAASTAAPAEAAATAGALCGATAATYAAIATRAGHCGGQPTQSRPPAPPAAPPLVAGGAPRVSARALPPALKYLV
jgi:hypothetical protein